MPRVFLTLLLMLVSAPFAWASDSIAVVDVVNILNHSKAAKNIQEQRETLREIFLNKIAKTEQELRQQEQELLEQRGQLPQEKYIEKRKAYEAVLLETRKKVQGHKRALENASNAAMNSLRDELYVIVETIAQEQGYKLVISNKNVIAGEKSLDITEETLKRLNEKLKKIPLDIEGE